MQGPVRLTESSHKPVLSCWALLRPVTLVNCFSVPRQSVHKTLVQGSVPPGWRVGVCHVLSSMFLQEQMELPEVPSEPLPEKTPGTFALCALQLWLLTLLSSTTPCCVVPANVKDQKRSGLQPR